jgi:divalent metal cation (Fe/Co/Zn/Cd) transporter
MLPVRVATPVMTEREATVRRGQRLTWATIAYNSVEAVLSIGAGLFAGSVALVGFGFDSVIELSSSVAGLWRLRSDVSPAARARAERHALRAIGACFLLLAGYVLVDALRTLVTGKRPGESFLGIVIAAGSLLVMPLLARGKRRVAAKLRSSALTAEARQTQICMYLSAILLGGLVLNVVAGWWWADPVAALVMVPLIAWEGVEAVRGRTACADCCEPLGGLSD